MTQESTATPPAARGPAARKAPRPVHPLLHKLFELYPRLFGARFLPGEEFGSFMATNDVNFGETMKAIGLAK